MGLMSRQATIENNAASLAATWLCLCQQALDFRQRIEERACPAQKCMK